MKRALLLAIVVVIAVVPMVNDVCGLDCDLDRQTAPTTTAGSQDCPLHHQTGPSRPAAPRAPAPDRCGHDHTTGQTGLVRTTTMAPRPIDAAVAVTSSRARVTLAFAIISRTALQHAPPIRSPRPLVLRI